MKTLSVRPAWAWLIVNLPGEHWKNIENRCWNTKHRGPLLVHASSGLTRAEHEEACELASEAGAGASDLPTFAQLSAIRGGLIGAVRLLDVSHPGYALDGYSPDSVWREHEAYGWHLADRVALPFRRMHGKLMLFDVQLTPTESAALAAAGLA